MKIAIYGTGKKAIFLCETLKKWHDEIDIVYFIETKKTRDSFYGKKVISTEEINYSDFLYLIIASDIYYEDIIFNLKHFDQGFEAHKDRIIKYRDFLLRDWKSARSFIPYKSCRVSDNLIYLASCEDEAIAADMYITGENYSEGIINAFFKLTEKYYKKSKKASGYFLDIGANIGTTSIYVKKKINPDLHVIGFEAGKENYDLFRVNCILNQVEDIKAELLGLSDSNMKKKYWYNTKNPGGSGIVGDNEEGKNITILEMVRLDDYLKNNNIVPNSIDYIWIDAESHESEIIDGAMETLSGGGRKIPLLQEFNPVAYFKKNALELYCLNIEKIYQYFLDVNEYIAGKENIMQISQIYDFAIKMIESGRAQTDLFFI